MRKSLGILLIFSIIIILVGCQNPSTGSLEVSKPTSTNTNQWIDVPYNKSDMDKLQQSVDEGHRVGEHDPEQVAMEFLTSKIIVKNASIQVKDTQNGICNASATLEDGRKMEFQLIQPATKGSLGIWIVTKYRYTRTNTINQWIDVPYNKADTDKEQQSVDDGHTPSRRDPKYDTVDFLYNVLNIKNPNTQVNDIQNGICNVSATLVNGLKMEFQLIQPATKGKSGIWIVTKYRYVN